MYNINSEVIVFAYNSDSDFIHEQEFVNVVGEDGCEHVEIDEVRHSSFI